MQKKNMPNNLAAQLAALKASQNFKIAQVAKIRSSSKAGAVVQRAKKRGDR